MKRSLYQLSLRRCAVAIIAFIATMVVLVGIAVAGEVSTAERSAEEAATIATLESLGRSTEKYEYRLERIAYYKEQLIADGCQEINLDACAEVYFSIDESDGFYSEKGFPNKEKTVLKNYITKEQVLEFGRTGEIPEGANFQVIYFKDENGNETEEPALFYVANPENKVFDISVIQESIDWLEKVFPGFLRTTVANNLRVILHSQANNDKRTQGTTYGDGIYYENYSGTNSESFYKSLRKGLPTEGVGIRCDILGMSQNEQGLIKPYFVLLFTQSALTKSNDKGLIDLEHFYQSETDFYTFLYANGRSDDQIKALREDAKEVVLAMGWTWEEIDAALAGN